jgi:hypothetical protein
MAFLGWLVRFIVLTIVVNLIWRALTSRRGPPATPDGSGAGRSRSGRAAERLGGALVRDPHCGTYIMQSRALRLGSGGDVHYFCSDTCRAAYQAAHPH